MTSWRNSRVVLDAANAVLAAAARPPARVPVARAARPGRGPRTARSSSVFEADLDDEADRVAAWFGSRARVRAPPRGARTTGAVLFRSKRHMLRFARRSRRRGIPHRILGLGGC